MKDKQQSISMAWGNISRILLKLSWNRSLKNSGWVADTDQVHSHEEEFKRGRVWDSMAKRINTRLPKCVTSMHL
jgi:hypothetical protein